MRILLTGCAGFIGYHLCAQLIKNKHILYGVDNLNNYYDVKLKNKRLSILKKNKNFTFKKLDISNDKQLFSYISNKKIDFIINLAAQAGVRYSLERPKTYLEYNIIGFFNILEACRKFKIKKLLFASSSSVYGENLPPFQENMKTDNPVQFYAATKKSNEVMAYAYHKLFDISCVGLRYFTVYGPLGRPDMAIYNFTKNIIKKKKINIYNNGNHQRDFTYISDAIDGTTRLINYLNKNKNKFEIFNIANGKTVELNKVILLLEKQLNKKAKKSFLSMQDGDIKKTKANISKLNKITGYKPKINIEHGIKCFVDWYKKFYRIK